ncbi:Tn3 family transposase [Streptomyces bauhiniae]|uniref:Tn3 family transposase n=1 Tax=Streptomyces bauhiniae TaxID=2340725 RepID=UPI003646088D
MPVLPGQRAPRSWSCLLNTCLLSKRPATAGSPRSPHPGSWNSSSAWTPGPWSSLGRSAVRLRGVPELLLEVAELTGMADAFTHISGADSHMEGFTTSLCAVLLTEACNVGFTPVIKPDVPALSRGRLVQVDQVYFRAENISVANGLFI